MNQHHLKKVCKKEEEREKGVHEQVNICATYVRLREYK
jgi:hypothetical protein